MPRHTASERRKQSSLGSIPRAGSKPKAPRANIGGRTPIPRAKTKGKQTGTAIGRQRVAARRAKQASQLKKSQSTTGRRQTLSQALKKQTTATKNPKRPANASRQKNKLAQAQTLRNRKRK